ncbi:stabilin-2 [Periophthalmus magnuspinnatus]|uniref:stabilin-2 n=1 Tax=Periophthalmus magnuspinnatus TaxID=409849 RepID=UPI0024368A7C|nr:stabilin-2 [Periophthalmus magnuspinnatus]
MFMNHGVSAANTQNFCSNSTVLRTRTACHSCSISMLIPCPQGYKITPGTISKDCKYNIRTSSLKLAISGCSFECYRAAETKLCCPGFWGPDCMECPEEASRPCSNNGICSDGLGGNGTCICKEGYAGTACEDCATGRYGPTCSSVCSCVHGLCDTGMRGSGNCLCFSGYKGPNCDQELPECSALNCGQSARCIEEAGTGQLVCQCLPGYRRDSANSECISINPCDLKPCHAHATCLHTGPNLHLCSCIQGYSGDGRVCMAVNPCQSNQGGCVTNSTQCVYDGPGKFHCECLPGFENLVEGRCSVKDHCRPDSCDKNAMCSTAGPGRVECTCLPGYIGSGKVCYGNIVQRLKELNTAPGGKWLGQLSNALTLFDSLLWPLENLGPFTIFLPVNKGFKGDLVKSLTRDITKSKNLCKMHLVAGMMPLDTLKRHDIFYTLTGKSAETDTSDGIKIRIHGSRKKASILESDIVASNGMIHLINKVMDSVSPTVESDPQENLMKIISDYNKFSKFQALLESVDLWSLMDTAGPLTVFAPVSSAFDNMRSGQFEYLTSTEGRTKLIEFLRNHIVQSTSLEIYNVVSSPRITTMANQILTINVTETGQILIKGAAVLEAAVEAKNGRLYVVDEVLTPLSIEPILPHRCDTTVTKVIKANCTSCSKIKNTVCPSGNFTGATFGCVYNLNIGLPPVSFAVTGCMPICNLTTTTAACCSGFYGRECSPCPGGYNSPCSGHGQCFDGLSGNGTCVCDPNFRGSRCQYCFSFDKHGPNCDKTCPCIHGQCDNRPESDGRCKPNSCAKGFTGLFCERQTAPCGINAQFCHAHADCDFSQGNVRCVCKPGYDGDGITCVESDPCAPPLRGGCSVNAKCIKTGVGTRTCQCLSGWREDGDDCQPINNCDSPERGGCHPNASCIYVGPGQSDCTCKSGYKGNGLDCEAVNPCVTTTGGCHYLASCHLISSEWKCVCDEHFTGDGRICYGSLEHELSILPGASGFYTWITVSGVSVSESDNNITLLVPSANAVDNLSLEDRNFWMTKGNLPSLIRNHMIPGNFPLHAFNNMSSVTSQLKTTLSVSTSNEMTIVGGAAITVPNLAATNGLIHIIDKVLFPDRKLSEGLLATLALRPDLSLFRSYLIEYNLTEQIEQGNEFTIFAPTDTAINAYLKSMAATSLDINTTRYHVVPTQYLLKTDLQMGGYKPTMLGHPFQLGIFPRDGKLFINDASVNSSNILSGRGVIHTLMSVLQINRNRCDKTDFFRKMGNCDDCFFPRKLCPDGFFPDKSQKKKNCLLSRLHEEKLLRMIGCKALCLKPTTEPQCCPGFFGQNCEACPGPKGQPCFGNGQCSDGINGTGVCVCAKHFDGTACEVCERGKYGIHCDQECLCKNGQCNEGIKGDGTCACDVGWRGLFCDEKIEFKSEELCGSAKCHSSANCVIRPSGPQCLCAAGFEGNGTSCQAKDACAVDNGDCSPYAMCKRTRPGQRQCVCQTGYSGDGFVCVEINPCLEANGGCNVNAECIHVGPNKTSCVCREGYQGNGQNCKMTDLCLKRNGVKGSCHRYARCNTTAPNVRTCTCLINYVGDGQTCRGTVGQEILSHKHTDFYFSLGIVEISLKGRGPFTVFVPNKEALRKTTKIKTMISVKNKEKIGTFLRSHIVMCHTLLPSYFHQPRNLTTLSGHVLKTRSSQGNIFINEANLTYSDGISVNGIFHEVDNILFSPNDDQLKELSENLNLTDVAERNGYQTFAKLLVDTGVIALLLEELNQPLTIFMPSDAAMASLPQEQKDFLYHPQNRAQLQEYLKYHILHNQKIYAEGLVHLDVPRTLQGSSLSFSCGGSDAIGEVFVNQKCRILQRHLMFNAGVAYGIDCLLTPPSLGGRCDKQDTFDHTTNCGLCSSWSTRCPKGSIVKETQKCDLPTHFVTKNSGCRSVCTIIYWMPKCCTGYFGRDCLACPGGVGSICSNRGKCDDGHLGNGTCTCGPGFDGVACELCRKGFYGPTCKVCNCTEHGTCDDGLKGTGLCFCEEGWTGERCETQLAEVYTCSPPCSPKAVCQQNNSCVCRLFHEGDGYTCTIVDMCQIWNGGCDQTAKCSQKGGKVSCTCPKGYSGDGYFCQPIDPCAAEDNGKCHEHAICTMTAPGKMRCNCKNNYIGDGKTCEVKQLPISRCLQNNGQCHQNAKCTDLHFEDTMLGVFHLRSAKGQYKLNYTQAQQACGAEGARLATYNQLSYAQQGGLNMCAAGWLDQARVAYPTTYSSPNCGFGHVGIVDYGVRKDLGETWDTFCYRIKEVKCECEVGYIGDGFSCIGTLLQVLRSTPQFSNFLSQILNYSQVSSLGKKFVMRLNNYTMQSTLFVPDNSGLADNQTLTQQDIEFHLLEGSVVSLNQLSNGTRIRNRLGSLTVLGIRDLQNPSSLSSRYINDRFVISADILASNGIIHVLQGPLKAPPPQPEMRVAHKAGLGVGVVLLITLVAGVAFVGIHFYKQNAKPFRFHYFKEEDTEEDTSADVSCRNITNPVYDSDPQLESTPPNTSDHQVVDQNGETNGASFDLLQDS